MTTSTRPPSLPQFGLKWSADLLTVSAEWTEEPSSAAMCAIVDHHLNRLLPSRDADAISLDFLAGGGFNKIYTICDSGSPTNYLLRVSLPVDPFYKTASEVATLRFLAQHVPSIPVPTVIAYSADAESTTFTPALQFEWILMTRLPGEQLEDHFTTCLNIKELATTLGCAYRDLQTHQFPAIGSLYLTDELPARIDHVQCLEYPGFSVGPIVDSHYYYENRRTLPSKRGPFSSERDWVLSLLDFQCTALKNPPKNDEDEEDEDDAADRLEQLEACRHLCAPVKTIFPESEMLAPAIISPHDVAARNLLIDPATGRLTGWVDWESVRIVPAWYAARELEAFEGPEMYNTYEDMQRQIQESEAYWAETNVPEEDRIRSRRNVLTMKLRELFRDAYGAVTDREEKAEKVVFMKQFGNLAFAPDQVLKWSRGWEKEHATDKIVELEEDQDLKAQAVAVASDPQKLEETSPISLALAQGKDPEKVEETSPTSPPQTEGKDPEKVEETLPPAPPQTEGKDLEKVEVPSPLPTQTQGTDQAKQGFESPPEANINRTSKKSFWRKFFCCFSQF